MSLVITYPQLFLTPGVMDEVPPVISPVMQYPQALVFINISSADEGKPPCIVPDGNPSVPQPHMPSPYDPRIITVGRDEAESLFLDINIKSRASIGVFKQVMAIPFPADSYINFC